MKLKGLGTLIIMVVALLSVLNWSSYGQKARPSEKLWEYKIVDEWHGEGGIRRNLPLNVKDVNEYGAQGWELVCIVAQGDARNKTFYFKRAR